MAAAAVSTVRVVDPRIEPQPNPVYATTVSAKQNQFYKIPTSGLSDSYLTFNNLTTLGSDRAYLDTFELEIEAEITFHTTQATSGAPVYGTWTFDSFPFNKCCDEIRVNVNGGAFFSQPLSYIRAKERYWNEMSINSSYENICPCNKPHMQNELGLGADNGVNNFPYDVWGGRMMGYIWKDGNGDLQAGGAVPTRFGQASNWYMPCSSGVTGSDNSAIIPMYPINGSGNDTVVPVKWREPIFCSPFSSRIDATYGRPLYNITSLDLAFNMQNLGNMIRCCAGDITGYEIHLLNVNLCYQVMTVPPGMAPSYTVIPYRRYVPYITDYQMNPLALQSFGNIQKITMTSGVYTLNEVPTAIWIFAAPTKATLQQNEYDGFLDSQGNVHATWTSNKLFLHMNHISISMANTTQILNTATVEDLYRIAKANGCQDSYTSWAKCKPILPKSCFDNGALYTAPYPYCGGAGSVLRLIPGTDIVLPDQNLVPGANASNMVFQVTADFEYNINLCPRLRDYALWVLFEYVGVAVITPGQCKITMNPLSNGSVMSTAPVVSSTPAETPSQVEGSGWLDKLKNILGVANTVAKKTGIIGTALGMIPGVGSVLQGAARTLGYGERKRARMDDVDDVDGGAVIGLGDFC